MKILYRYVPYGTCFRQERGGRPRSEATASTLYENEIAADVGGAYWPNGDFRPLPVIDHHFVTDFQFPSASAAVLHCAVKINRWWQTCRSSGFTEVWLVTHENPDFDAFASLYLIRSLQDWIDFPAMEWGLSADGWRDLSAEEHPPKGRPRMDWFSVPVGEIDGELRWRFAIAVTASMSDACRRFSCPKTQSPPAILYAALQRGRPFLSDGALTLFDHIRDSVRGEGLNPVIDEIFGADSDFCREVAVLEREVDAYQRDVRRARKSLVSLPTYKGDFEEYFQSVSSKPLLDEQYEPEKAHRLTDGPPMVGDGIFLRDPESLLFKDLARMDLDNSSFHQGFLFTAVAYSNGRPEAIANRSDYYFALDPERSGKATLYPLWATLQVNEITHLRLDAKAMIELSGLEPRLQFRERAASLGGLMHDPWFDGANYNTTLVATPHRGSAIVSVAVAPDLTDDPIVLIVRESLEYSAYGGLASILQFLKSGAVTCAVQSIAATPPNAPEEELLRFSSVLLTNELDIRSPKYCQQIGEQLWKVLEPEFSGLPDDFGTRHLIWDGHSVSVWSRRGVALAYLPDGHLQARRCEAQFRKMAELLVRTRAVTSQVVSSELDTLENLLREIALIREDLAIGRSLTTLRRFVDVIGLHEHLAIVRDLLDAQRGRREDIETRRIASATEESIFAVREGQDKVELLEILFVTLYSIELVHIILEQLDRGSAGIPEVRLICGLGALMATAAALGLSKRERVTKGNISTWSGWKTPMIVVPALTIGMLILGFAITFEPILSWYNYVFRTTAAK